MGVIRQPRLQRSRNHVTETPIISDLCPPCLSSIKSREAATAWYVREPFIMSWRARLNRPKKPRRRGAATDFQGRAGQVLRQKTHRDCRTVRRDQRADLRLLDVAGKVEGRSDRMGQAIPQPRITKTPRLKSARSSKPKTSAPSSLQNSESKRSACANRWPSRRNNRCHSGPHRRVCLGD
jgi:hypothetical protein